MTGSDEVGVQILKGVIEESLELDLLVAEYVGVWGASGFVL